MKLFFSFIVLTIFFTGCIKEEKKIDQKETDNSYTGEIPVIDEVWLKNKIEQRNGKPLFVNFWATWCVPCVEEFPDLVKIYNENKNSQFEFLSVSVDLPSEIETKVKPFLLKQEADFPVVVVEEKRSDEVINFINPEWSGAVPLTVIYNKDGTMQSYIPEAKDYEFFKKSIDEIKNN
ncbi:MAG TPA: TlpA disulfide reductase family protein [Ignavibacteriaceae bacterium]|nr:TlpA disulfide reductase family protein [Ignavibacteriaceae bacterium]